MKLLLIVLLTLSALTSSFGQTDSFHPIELTKKNLQKALQSRPYQTLDTMILSSCNYDADTIQLYTKGFEGDCCRKVEWVFKNHSDFIYKYRDCMEPSKFFMSGNYFTIQPGKENGQICLQVYWGAQLSKLYIISAIDRIDRKWERSVR